MSPILLRMSLAVLTLTFLGGCFRQSRISEKDVSEWPLKVSSVEILCDEGGPSVAVVNGVQYALNGLSKAKAKKEQGVDLPFLNHEVPGLFKPNPDPVLRSRGIPAYIGSDFLTAAARVCE